MSFTNAPVTKTLVTALVSLSILASLLDIKHSFYILTELHLWRYGQLWRIPIFQLCYSNATEVLFGSMTLYSLRTVERFWGSRKFASFLITSYILTSLLVPLIQVLLVAPLSRGRLTYIPSGPTPLIFAILAQYHAMVPHLYEYRIVFSPSPSPPPSSSSHNTSPTRSSSSTTGRQSSNSPPVLSQTHALTFSDKSTKYLPPAHLFLSSLPISPFLALTGWTLGYLHRTDGLLPPRITRWRVPRWLVGDSFQSKPREGFEGLQRRLVEQEGGVAVDSSSSGVSSGAQQQGQRTAAGLGSGDAGGRRRNIGQQILDQFRGAF